MGVKKGYKQSVIGVIPESWEISTIGSLGIFSKGQGVRKDEAKSGDIPCVRYGELYTLHHDFIKEFGSYISREVAETSKKLKNGDILFAGSGETKEEIGKSVAFVDSYEAYVGGDVVILSPNCGDSLFYGYLFNLPLIAKQKANKGQGDAIVHISAKALSSILVPIPSLPEQQAIATALFDIDSLINSLTKLINKKKRIKQGAMQELLTGKKRLEGFSGEWSLTTLENLCYLITKQTGFDYTKEIKPSLKKEIGTDGLPFIQNKDFNGRVINLNTDFYIPRDIAHKYPNIMLNEKCLLISISGKIGNVGVFSYNEEAFIGGAVGIARFIDKSSIDWVMLYLQSKEGQNQIFSKEKAGAQHNITVFDVRKLSIPIPTKEEMGKIVQVIFDLDNEIEKLETKLVKYKKIKQGMMQELLTGRIRLLEEVVQ